MKLKIAVFSVCLLLLAGVTGFNLFIHPRADFGMENLYDSVESIYGSSNAVYQGQFIKKWPVEKFLPESPGAQVYDEVEFYDFCITKIYKGHVTDKIIQIPQHESIVWSDGTKTSFQFADYPLNRKVIVFLDPVYDKTNNKSFYLLKNISQSMIEIGLDGESLLDRHQPEKEIFKAVRSLSILEKKFQEINKK